MLNSYKQILIDFLMCSVQIIIIAIENRVSHRGDKNLKPFFFMTIQHLQELKLYLKTLIGFLLLLTNGMLNFIL